MWVARVVKRAEWLVFDGPVWLLLVVLVAVSVAKDGFGTAPGLPSWVAMARSFPGRPPGFTTLANYLFESPIGPAIGHLVGATGRRSFTGLCVAALVAAVAVLVIGLRRRGGRTLVGVGLTALFASALSNTVPSWLGLYDPFTLGFASLAVLFDAPPLLALAGLGLGVSDIGIGALIVVTAVGFRALAQRREAPLRCAALLVGFVVGALLTTAYQHHAHAGSGGELAYFRTVGPRTFVRLWLMSTLTWAFSVFGVWWYVLGRLAEEVMSGLELLLFGAVTAVALALSVVTADETRLSALVVWPAVLCFALRIVAIAPRDVVRKVITVAFLAAVVVPRVWVEGGLTLSSAWHP